MGATICPLSMAGPQPRECAHACAFCPPADWAELGNIWEEVHVMVGEGVRAEVLLRGSTQAIPAAVNVTAMPRGWEATHGV